MPTAASFNFKRWANAFQRDMDQEKKVLEKLPKHLHIPYLAAKASFGR